MPNSTQQIGKELFKYMKARSGLNVFKLQSLRDLFLRLSIARPQMKQRLFHFIDLLPVLKSSKQKSQYFAEYLAPYLPEFIHQNKLFAGGLDLGIHLATSVMAQSFICGSNIKQAQRKIKELERHGLDYTIDILGELALTQKEADHYFKEYLSLIQELKQANISVKLSALIPQTNQLDYQGKKFKLKHLLREIYRAAIKQECFINVDTEHYAWKEMTYAIIQELLMEEEFRSWQNAGIVLQAYLKESSEDLKSWLSWATKRGSRITIRLVKGAYWDYEKAIAEQNGFELPVYEHKYESDINYEKLSQILLESHRLLRPAIASHNIRSLAAAIYYAQSKGINKTDFEFQMLYGMLDPIKDYLVEQGYQCRVYMPYGELIPGMSYLVRRLLENTANDSFLRQGFLDGKDIELLLQDPTSLREAQSATKQSRLENSGSPRHFVARDDGHFKNSPNTDFSQKINRKKMQEALEQVQEEIEGKELYRSSLDDCKRAVNAAHEAYCKWSKAEPKLRAAILKHCAKELEKQRYRFNSLICIEVFKPWQEADREVSEAIDFLNYYASQALELINENRLNSVSGEKNTNYYQAYGVALVISPWNFPLALMAGMSSAALVMGNSVIVKPSERSPIVALEFIKLLNKSIEKLAPHYSRGLLHLLCGSGKTIGAYLAEHKLTRLIAFTGSNATGMKLNETANRAKPIKRMIAEMGGKNAIIVDQSADPDEAIPGILYSAFAYAGQKCSACSRLIVEGEIYDEFKQRLVEAAKSINIGDPCKESTTMGPVIDKGAYQEIQRYIKIAKRDGHSLLEAKDLPEGNYISPCIVEGLAPDHIVVEQEVFGPVLVLLKARDIDHAIELANQSNYGLTGGLYSRSPKNIVKVTQGLQVGNLYINRPCTGAVVSRQAFGGLKESSIGFKAGGPNYLLQFVQEKTISENTMRRGFVAD